MVKKRPGVNARLTIQTPVYKPLPTASLCPFLSRLKRHRPTTMRELPVVAEARATMSVADLADDELRGNDARCLAPGDPTAIRFSEPRYRAFFGEEEVERIFAAFLARGIATNYTKTPGHLGAPASKNDREIKCNVGM